MSNRHKLPTLADLSEAWAKDCPLDIYNIEAETARSMTLHAKYHDWWTQALVVVAKKERFRDRVASDFNRYYRRLLTSPEDLERLGKTEPWRVSLASNDVKTMVLGEPLYIDAVYDYRLADTLCKSLEEKIRVINHRKDHIRNVQEQRKFDKGYA